MASSPTIWRLSMEGLICHISVAYTRTDRHLVVLEEVGMWDVSRTAYTLYLLKSLESGTADLHLILGSG